MKKRILATVLILAILALGLASCGLIGEKKTAEELLAEAEEALLETSYSASATTVLASGDPALSEKMASIDSVTINYAVSGKDFTATMNVAVGGASVSRTYTVIENILYVKSVAEIGGQSVETKKQTEITPATTGELLASLGVGAKINYKDFETYESEDVSGSSATVTCSGIKADSLDGAESVLDAALFGAGYELELKDVTLVANITNGKYASTELTYTYSVTKGGVAYDMTAILVTNYDYSETTVSVPANTDDYEMTTHEDALK